MLQGSSVRSDATAGHIQEPLTDLQQLEPDEQDDISSSTAGEQVCLVCRCLYEPSAPHGHQQAVLSVDSVCWVCLCFLICIVRRRCSAKETLSIATPLHVDCTVSKVSHTATQQQQQQRTSMLCIVCVVEQRCRCSPPMLVAVRLAEPWLHTHAQLHTHVCLHPHACLQTHTCLQTHACLQPDA